MKKELKKQLWELYQKMFDEFMAHGEEAKKYFGAGDTETYKAELKKMDELQDAMDAYWVLDKYLDKEY